MKAARVSPRLAYEALSLWQNAVIAPLFFADVDHPKNPRARFHRLQLSRAEAAGEYMDEVLVDAGMRHVMEGRTFYGHPGSLKPIHLGNNDARWGCLRDLIASAGKYFPEPTDERMTALTWKVLSYGRRYNFHAGTKSHEFTNGMWGAFKMVCNVNSMLLGKISLEGAWRAHRRERLNRPLDRQPTARVAERYQREMRNVPEPELLAYTVRYRLFKLTHPHHLVEEGLAMKNCLVEHTVYGPIPNRLYWKFMATGEETILSFRRWEKRVCTIALCDWEVSEFDFRGTPRDRERLKNLLERTFGRLQYP